MKVSKDQKDEIRKKLLEAAVVVMTEKGFNAATMREISSKAEFGTATIYNYFATKEKILYAYFLDKHKELVKEINVIPDFDTYTLKEKLQSHLESLLGLYLKDREFVRMAYKMMFDSPLRTFTEFAPVKDIFTETIRGFMDSAIEKSEIAEHPFKGFINNVYWDYSSLMLLYWLNDESEGFSNTSQLIDMTLDIIVDILKSGIIARIADILSFLFRSHIYGNVQNITKLFSAGNDFQALFKVQSNEKKNGGNG
jgi:AcrR family transcriptional regulator